MSISHIYSGNPLDRGERERRDEKWITDMASSPTSKFLAMKDLTVPVSEGSQDGLGWLSVDEMRQFGINNSALFLGLLSGVACFVVDISNQEHAIQRLSDIGDYKYIDARAATEILSGSDSGIVAQARAQVDWHKRHGFCSTCGHETVVRRSGQTRHCSMCDVTHYPRTDPVIITVVSDNDLCLLGQSRGRGSSTNRYSALAGFVDQGESIEEAVVREVMEESGIAVKNVRYHSSQPWPVPSSLMIGCHAEAATTDIFADAEEMVDVCWFQRDEVLKALKGTSEILVVPGPIAIAHHLIKAWATNDLP
ncbi:MAG: NAD(+) diphosphatase [Chloroflexi bacterium]|nr:NAD(+) diphosphatase [Chloroflexota bacterium]